MIAGQLFILWFMLVLQEAASAVSEEVSIIRTDETDSRRDMVGQRNVSTVI